MIHPMIFLLLLFGLASAQFLPNGCPEDFSVHLLLPHETDCQRFYSCSNGQRILMQCGVGTLFDVHIQVCNHAHAVDCQTQETTTTLPEVTTEPVETTTRSSITTTTPVIPPTTPNITSTAPNISTTTPNIPSTTPIITSTTLNISSTTPNITSTTTTSTTNNIEEFLPNGCPADFSVHLLLPHESDCSKFYSCSNGRRILMHCPSTLFFDFDLQHCNWPQYVDCNIPTTTETTRDDIDTETDYTTPLSNELEEIITNTSTSKPESTNTTVDKITTLALTTNGPVITSTASESLETTTDFPSTPSICPDNFFGVIPHPELCDSYYTCTGWSPIQLFCRPGLEFDPQLEKCVEISEGGCTWLQNPVTNETTPTEASTENNTSLGSTTVSYITAGPTTEDLTTENTSSDETTQDASTLEPLTTTEQATTESITPSITTEDSNTETTVFPTTLPVTDAQTTISTFSTEKATSLAGITSATTEEQTFATEHSTISNLTSTDSPAATSELKELTTAIPTTIDLTGICPGEFFGNVPHPSLCDAYYFCSGWSPILLYCPSGQEFNPQSQSCAVISESGCTWKQNSTSSTESAIETSTSDSSNQHTTESLPTTIVDVGTADTNEPEEIFETTITVTDTTLEVTTENVQTDSPTTLEVATGQETDLLTTITDQSTVPEEQATQAVSTEKSTTLDSTFASTIENWETTSDQEGTETVEVTSEHDPTPTTIERPNPVITCPVDYFGNLPHPELCDAYFLCSGWEPILLFCPSSKEFDPASGECVVVAEGGCTWFQMSTTVATEQTTITSSDVPTNVVTEYISTTSDVITDEDVTTVFWETTMFSKPTDKLTTFEPSTDNLLSTVETTTLQLTETTTDTVFTTEEETSSTYKATADGENTTMEITTEKISTDSPITIEVTTDQTVVTEVGPLEVTTKKITTLDPITIRPTTENFLTTSDQEKSTQNNTEVQTESTTAQPKPVIVCPDGYFGNLPHPDRCDAYFLCSGWDPILLFCPSGNEFDPVAGTCVAIAESGCNWQKNSTTPVTEHTIINTTPDGSTDAVTSDFITANESTTVSWETPTSSQSAVDLTTFETTTGNFTTSEPTTFNITEASTYEATTDNVTAITEAYTTPESTNEPETTTVNIDTTFEVITELTNFPMTTQEITTESVVIVTEDETTQTIRSTLETEGTTVQPTPVICPDGYFGNAPHPERCDAYYMCTGWDPILLFCPSGNEFEPAAGTCVVIAEGGCNWQKNNTTSVTEHTTIHTSPDVSTDVVTSDFITANGSTTVSRETPTSSVSAVELTTIETTTGNFTTSEPTTFNVTEASTFEATTDNVTTITEAHTTPESANDTETTTVNIDTTFEVITETYLPTTTQEITTESVVTENEETTPTIQSTLETEGTTVQPTPVICPDGYFGNVLHQERCDAYFMCSGWDPILLFCPSGNEFDPAAGTCVVIAEGGCNWQKNSTTSVTEHSTVYTSPDVSTDAVTQNISSTSDVITENGFTTEPWENKTSSVTEQTVLYTSPDVSTGAVTENVSTTSDAIATGSGESKPSNSTDEQTIFETTTGILTTSEYITLNVTEASTYEATTDNVTTITEAHTTLDPTNEPETTTVNIDTTFEVITESTYLPTTTQEITTESVVIVTEDEETSQTIQSTLETEGTTVQPTPVICPDGYFGNAPHPERCDAYFMCSGWDPILLFCPSGNEFDPAVGTCVVIAVGGCNWQKNSTTPVTEHTTIHTSPGGSTDAVTSDLITANGSTTLSWETPTSSESEVDLTTVETITGNFTTSKPTTFNVTEASTYEATTDNVTAITEAYTTPESTDDTETTTVNVETTFEVITESTYLPTTTQEITTESVVIVTEDEETSQTIQSTLETEGTSVQPTPVICPDGYFGNVPHTERCDAYFMCTGWEPILLFCPSGNEYDPAAGICVVIAEGGCNWQKNNTTSVTEQTTIHTTPDGSTDAVTSDLITANGSTTVTPISSVSAVDLTTFETTTGNFTTSEPTTFNVTEASTYEATTDNVTAITEAYTTSESTNDTETTTVNIDTTFEVITESTYLPTTKQEITTESVVIVTEDEETTQTIQSTLEIEGTTVHPTPVICPDGYFGNVPHPERCDAYFMCTGWDPILLFCPSGNEFDPALGTCVVIAEGGCNWQEISTNSVTEHSTVYTSPDVSTDAQTQNISSTTDIITENGFTTEPWENKTSSVTEQTILYTSPDVSTHAVTEDVSTTSEAITTGSGESKPSNSTDEQTIFETTTGILTTSEYITLNVTEASTYEATTDNVTTITEAHTNLETTNDTETTTVNIDTTFEVITETYLPTTTQEITTESVVIVTEDEETTQTVQSTLETEGITVQPTPVICPDGYFGNVPHPERCDAYYMCSGWDPILLFCPSGNEFDPAAGTCVVIAEGGCNWQKNNTTSVTEHSTVYTSPDVSTDAVTQNISSTSDVITENGFTTEPWENKTSSVTEQTVLYTSPDVSTGAVTENVSTTSDAITTGSGESKPSNSTDEQTIFETTTGILTTSEYITLNVTEASTYEATTDNVTTITEAHTTLDPTNEPETTTVNIDTTFEVITESTYLPTTTQEITTESVVIVTEDVETTQTIQSTLETEGTTVQPTPVICPDGYFGNAPHPERCDAYFMCSGWDPILLFCPSGNEFDPAVGTCVVIAVGGCNWQKNSTTHVTEHTTIQTSPDGSTDAVTSDFITANGSTTVTWETSISSVSPVDLTTFETTRGNFTTSEPTTFNVTEASPYEATTENVTAITEAYTTPESTNEPETTTVNIDTTFEVITELTNFPMTTQEITTESVVIVTEDETTQTIQSTLETEGTTVQPTPVICPDGYFGNAPHPERCDAYYMCSGWDPILLFCPSGNEFDPDAGTCVVIAVGGCNWQKNSTTHVTEHTTIHTSPHGSTDAVTSDLITANGTTTSWETSTSSESAVELTTFETTTENFTTSQPTTSNVTEASTYEETTDNVTAITEAYTTPESTNEPETTTVNIDTTFEVITESTYLPTTTQEITTESVVIVTEDEETTQTIQSTLGTEGTTVQPTPVICPDGYFGNVPHPERCDAYYMCSGWDPILLFCPSGNEFDPAAGTCVVIAVGGCNWQKNNTTSVSEHTTIYTSPDGSTDAVTSDFISANGSTTVTPMSSVSAVDLTTFETTTENFTTSEPTIFNVTEASTYEATTDNATTITEAHTNLETTNDTETTTVNIDTTFEVITESTYLPTTTQEITTESVVIVTEDEETTQTIQSTLETEGTTVQPTPVICPDGYFGNVPHPERCDAYYMCSGWDPILLFCPSGNEFDPAAGTCVVIAEGGCNWQKNSTTSVTEHSTVYTSPDVSTDAVTQNISSTTDVTTDNEFTTGTWETTTSSVTEQTLLYSSPDLSTDAVTEDVSTTSEAITTGSGESKPSNSTDEQTIFETTTGILTTSEYITLNVTEASTYEATTDNVTTITEAHTTLDPTNEPETTTVNIDTTFEVITESTNFPMTTQEITESVVFVTEDEETTQTIQSILETEGTTVQPTLVICPDGYFGNVPHTERCDAYFMCTGWEPILLFCPSGNEYDPVLGTCVVIAAGGCNWQKNNTNAVTERTTMYTSPDKSTNTASLQTTVETIIDDISTLAPTTPKNIENTTVSNVLTTEKTTETIIFEPSTTTDAELSTLEPTTEANEVTTPEICPSGFFGSIANPEACDAYYMCSGWMPIPLRCPNGFEFDPSTESCVQIAVGGCTWHSTSTVQPSTEASSSKFTTTDELSTTVTEVTLTTLTATTPEDDIFVPPNPGPAPPVEPEVATEKDDLVSTTTEEAVTPPICPDGYFGSVPHPEECDTYFMCSGWMPIQLRCSAGFEFDPATQSCVAVADGGCTYNQASRGL
ncbi:hypothetical protein O0L34_g13422 [Tuta absoluta]|nr:hypothetical protein O0L34_g13422 [Tuta absoluta]